MTDATWDSRLQRTDARTPARRDRHRRKRGGRAFTLVLATLGVGLACAPIAYMVWPKPMPLTPDAPSLPMTVADVAFNIPPASIRFKVQRRPGAQPRLDLAFVWPSLKPPDSSAKPLPTETPGVTDRLFVTIAASDGALAPTERLKVIYPRYTEAAPVVGADGLSTQAFKDGSPYQGEDLVLDAALPERFASRCTRRLANTPPMCLHERRIGAADITVRFPREWLSEWNTVANGIEALIAGFRPTRLPG